MWPAILLPGVVLETVELEILNDNLFSKIWFNYNEHSRIDEASPGPMKRVLFLHTLRRCEARVIDVFLELCRENYIECITRGKFYFELKIGKMYACTFLNACCYYLRSYIRHICMYSQINYIIKLTGNNLMLQATKLWSSGDSNLLKEVMQSAFHIIRNNILTMLSSICNFIVITFL